MVYDDSVPIIRLEPSTASLRKQFAKADSVYLFGVGHCAPTLAVKNRIKESSFLLHVFVENNIFSIGLTCCQTNIPPMTGTSLERVRFSENRRIIDY